MAVHIRLRRAGTTRKPAYRVVVADSRSARDGRFLEVIGHYNPLTEPPTVKIDRAKARAWIEKGAQPTEQVGKLLEITGVWEQYRAKHGSPAATAPKPHAAKPPAPAKAASE